ncbi:hypothetical protein I3760_03G165600 [Carya illinoinensis]|uniref:Uncharacterized protein n=1 Tax=Carya illinoinensis TaxID=32201 RepID=A0A922JZ05_CARIL|nr:hypothetical protein I3760_03G165600 [Carya illinoinensis]KAG6722514.1 hypothetical protein I3842_03G164400 [Carya illinoinensis]
MDGGGSNQGLVMCGSWIQGPDKVNLVVLRRSKLEDASPSQLEIFSFDPKTTSLSSSPLYVCIYLPLQSKFTWF